MQIPTPLNMIKVSNSNYIPADPGDICYSLRSTKSGWLLCDGQEVSRSIYSALFEEIGTTYGEGDGSTTFNIPDYRGMFLQMVPLNKTVGQYIEAGLPNITGKLSGNRSDIARDLLSITGCFSGETLENRQFRGSTEVDVLDTLSFDASRSSSIYGKSNTVQPPAFTVNYFIKY